MTLANKLNNDSNSGRSGISRVLVVVVVVVVAVVVVVNVVVVTSRSVSGSVGGGCGKHYRSVIEQGWHGQLINENSGSCTTTVKKLKQKLDRHTIFTVELESFSRDFT